MAVLYGVICVSTRIISYLLVTMMHSGYGLGSQDGVVHQNVLYIR